MNDAQRLIAFAKDVLAGIEEELDDSDELGRRLYAITKGFIKAAKEDPDPGEVVETVKQIMTFFR
jgi:hypothetical protein